MPKFGLKIRSFVLARKGEALGLPVVLLCFTWMVTYGTFEIYEPEHFTQFYDAQARSLLAGHWDVPAKDIFPESFSLNGKSYGYFGFVPAIPRMLLNGFLPSMYGAWSRISMIAGCAVTLWCCGAFLRRAHDLFPGSVDSPWLNTGFLILAGLGSTVIYLGSRAFIYHEAILWGVSLALASYLCIFDYVKKGSLSSLGTACVLAFLSFFTRISSGCGPLLSLGLVAIYLLCSHARRPDEDSSGKPSRPAYPLRHAMIICIGLTVVVAVFVCINHEKFGTYLQPAPMTLHEQTTSDPMRLARTGGKWMSVGNIPTTAWAYFSPQSISFGQIFPWVYMKERLQLLPGEHIDGWGPFSSVTAAMPVWFVMSVFGVSVLFSGMKSRTRAEITRVLPLLFVLAGTLAPAALILCFSSVDNRYLHEFFPFLIISSSVGAASLNANKVAVVKKSALAAVIFIGAVQIYFNLSFSLVYQRLLVYDRPSQPEIQMRHWQQNIDSIIHAGR